MKNRINPKRLLLLCFLFVVLECFFSPNNSPAAPSHVAPQKAKDRIFRPAVDVSKLPIFKDEAKDLTGEQFAEIRALFKKERFGTLSAMMDKYVSAMEEDPLDEFRLNSFLGIFREANPDAERLLLKWEKTFPYNYQPYLVLAEYYFAKGWESRGNRYVADTTDEQFQGMYNYFQKAEDNIAKALKIKPKLMPAYRMLISMYDAYKPEMEENQVIQTALEKFPHSFLVWSSCIKAKEPRWGGSYAQMQALAKEAEQYSTVNPNLIKLYGFIYIDQSRYLEEEKRYPEAVELLNEALQFGDRPDIHYRIADIYYYNLKNYPRALEECDKAIQLVSGGGAGYYLLRSKIYYDSGNYQQALKDWETATRTAPFFDDAKKWAKWAGRDLMLKGHKKYKDRHVRAAVSLFNLSLKFNDQDFETYYWRGKSSFDKGDAASALKDFERALALNPRHFYSVAMIDYIANSEQQFDYSIGYWDRFLKLEPTHAKAYLNRARAYYYKRDLSNCQKDLAQACSLGNREACSRANNVRQKRPF